MPVAVSSRLRRRLRLSPLQTVADQVLRAAGAGRAGLGLLLVGDRLMRRLNRLYRRQDRTTDVLAFPLAGVPFQRRRAGRSGRGFLGDIVISLPQAARQASRAGHPLECELAVLVTHGVLHLLGYDHERSARDARRMQRKERAILRTLPGLATRAFHHRPVAGDSLERRMGLHAGGRQRRAAS
jgi:rRNA maturation RNase YbeY